MPEPIHSFTDAEGIEYRFFLRPHDPADFEVGELPDNEKEFPWYAVLIEARMGGVSDSCEIPPQPSGDLDAFLENRDAWQAPLEIARDGLTQRLEAAAYAYYRLVAQRGARNSDERMRALLHKTRTLHEKTLAESERWRKQSAAWKEQTAATNAILQDLLRKALNRLEPPPAEQN